MMYPILRPLLFCLEPEFAHSLVLNLLRYIPGGFFARAEARPLQCMGVNFSHPIGLAAGLDKNGTYLDALSKLGFAFIEIGTVTPRPQFGNVKPRLFRIPEAHALINRMGFNNHGVDVVVQNLQRTQYDGVVGVNIGKNKDTPLHQAVDDYRLCLNKVYAYASYVTINISSPNTPDLKQLQHQQYFDDLLREMRQAQAILADKHQRHVPLLVKISPDESTETLKQMAETINQVGLDGVIATNTTCERQAVRGLSHADEVGGLSGRPLAQASTASLQYLRTQLESSITIIASGGIDSVEVAQQKMSAGADLLQLYTGLIYQGPGLIRKLVAGFKNDRFY